MKILLTGATGFFGTHLAESLINDSHQVIAIKRKKSDISYFIENKIKIEFLDIEDGLEVIFKKNKDIELIIHVATNYGNNSVNYSELFFVNVMLPLRLLELSQANSRCPFLSTDTYFTKAGDGYSYLEGYIQTKKIFQDFGIKFSNLNKRKFINIRLEHIYGPGDGEKKFLTYIAKELISNTPTISLTKGEQLRDFIYVTDAVDAYRYIINSKEVLSGYGIDHFDVGTGETISIRRLVEILHDEIGSQSKLEFGKIDYRENEIMSSVANISHLKKLGWERKVDIITGLNRMISYMKGEK